MRAIIVNRHGPDVLSLAEVNDPRPEPDEVLVRIRSASLNYGEVVHAHGLQDNGYPHSRTERSSAQTRPG